MTQPDIFAAELLETSANGYATLAADRLLAAHPDLSVRFAPDAISAWKATLSQRLVELAAALRLGEPRLFAARGAWARRAFATREVPESALRASLEALAGVLEEELPEAARHAPAALLREALQELNGPAEEDGSSLDPRSETGKLALEYLATVLEGNSRRATDRVLAAVDRGLPVESAYLDVLVQAQREIGRLWHAGELGIVEEHVVTYTTERLMSLLAHRAARAPDNGRTVVCAAVAGNVHDIGVRVIADFFDVAGWRTVHLGASVPAAEIASGVQYFDGDLLILSAALSVQLPRVADAIAAVRRREGSAVRIMVGGLAFSEAPELWRKLGADGYALEARSAVRLGTELVSAANAG
jgi:MerR family transcriptional regulator, light-induced transcriptional regulator